MSGLCLCIHLDSSKTSRSLSSEIGEALKVLGFKAKLFDEVGRRIPLPKFDRVSQSKKICVVIPPPLYRTGSPDKQPFRSHVCDNLLHYTLLSGPLSSKPPIHSVAAVLLYICWVVLCRQRSWLVYSP